MKKQRIKATSISKEIRTRALAKKSGVKITNLTNKRHYNKQLSVDHVN